MSSATHHGLTFSEGVKGFLRAHGQLSFLQIGGYDGVSFDPLREHILKGDLTGVIVEPVPMHFEKLQALYAGSDRIKVENCAVDATEGERTMWFFSREAIAKGTIGQVFGGITSFLLPNLLEKGGTLGGLYSEENRAILNSLVESISVPCHTYDTIIARNGLQRIDLLQIDTEGYDYELLKVFDFQRHRPAIVHYECQHLNPQDKAAAEDLLRSHGYVLSSNGYDTLALRGVFHMSGDGELPAMIDVADQLLNEQRYAQALTIYDHVLRVDPDNLLVAVNSGVAATRLGDHVDALRRVKPFGHIIKPGSMLSPFLSDIKGRAAIAYNEKVNAKDLNGAVAIIDGLIALDPKKYLSIGLSVAEALQKTELVENYSKRLMEINPAEWYPHFAYSEVAKKRGDIAPWLHHATRAILLRPWTPADRDISASSIVYFLVADILAHPECAEALGHVNELRAKLDEVVQDFPEERDRLTERFMRVSLDALDTSILERPLTDDAPRQPALTFADAQGAVLTAEQWQQRILAASPRVTFLASADEIYLQRYGRNYVRAMLERCDVDCAVVIGLVGEPERLKAIVESIGVTDPRLFYFVDTFDPAYAVSYYSTKECRTDCANAYYQSSRFLVLEYLLTSLQLPFIVTDIDLHLQGSVADLLERHAGKDIVLNKNASAASYGSRFTANLTLFRPGRTAQQFARTLRLFLKQSLKRQHIEQFIDQTAFSLANYYCRRHGLNNIGAFREDEINNVMLNRTDMGPAIAELAKRFVFFAYYGSQGESAIALMQATAAQP